MDWTWLKRSMPRGLYGRAALILVLPIAVMVLVISVVFIQRHFEDVTRQMTRNMLLDLEFALDRFEAGTDPQSALALAQEVAEPLAIEVSYPDSVKTGYRRLFYDISGATVVRTLQARLPEVLGIDLANSIRAVDVYLETQHGPILMRFARRRVSASNPHQLLVLMIFTGVVMTGVAFVYLRNQLRPIARLARAADAYGKGQPVAYRPSGAVEVRAAGQAFLDMRDRIERQTESRTMMLSGVSHDLRTPLTRLRLGLSIMEQTEDVKALEQDVAEMEALVSAFLDFAKGEALDDPERIDPVALAQDIVAQHARGGAPLILARAPALGTQMVLRPLAVRRALGNLISNALRYGNRAELSVVLEPGTLRFLVEDDGPGIPEADREQALRPFARLDAARNQDKGSGVGLGLAIASDIARGHGGSLVLGESMRLGGLQAELRLAR